MLDGGAETLKMNEDVGKFNLGLGNGGRTRFHGLKFYQRPQRTLEAGKTARAHHPAGLIVVVAEPSSIGAALQQALARSLRESNSSARGSAPDQPFSWPLALEAGDVANRMAQRLRELGSRARRPEDPMAMALSSFLPSMDHPEGLELAGITRFRELNFDARCPTGIRGTPPHIEVVASGPAGVVGVTVHVFDYLMPRQIKLSAGYATLQVPPAMEAWAELMRTSVAGHDPFHYVDVPTLGKLAVGLGRIFQHRPVRLLYLFLEPVDAVVSSPFVEHRMELARLTELTQDSGVMFFAISFHELWEEWCAADPAKLRAVAAQLSRCYAVATPR